MAGNKTENEKIAPIIVKKIIKKGGGHHGGAWKVAYADFVTAMMAFFLLLWLLNVTTEDQKNAISNYFDPSHPKVSDVVSGAGGLLGGMTMTSEGAMVSTVQPIVQPEQPDTSTRGALEGDDLPGDAQKVSEEKIEEEFRKQEDAKFKVAADKLKAEIQNSPELKDMINNLVIDITPEGLRIQIVDDKGRSMFPSGSAVMFDFMRQILLKVTTAVLPLDNQVSVRGHTDSVKYKDPKGYDNWNLSSDRAQASRRVMVEGGLAEKRIENVMGRSDRDHLLPNEPANPRNRRISIILLRDHAPKKAVVPMPQKQSGTASPAAEKAPAKGGITIIDDTQPVPVTVTGAQAGMPASGSGHKAITTTTTTTTTKAAPAPVVDTYVDGSSALPVTPGATGAAPAPKVITFGDTPTGSDTLYTGPTQSPYIENKPPTITTPLYHLEPAPDAHKAPKAATPAMPTSSMTYDDATPAPAPDNAAKRPPVTAPAKVMTFGDAVPENTDAVEKPANGQTNTKVLTFP